MDKIVRNPNGGSRQATAGDVAKNPKERARLQNQADEYRSLKANVTYRRQKEDRDKTTAAVKAGEEDAALIKNNPQVAVLRKQQAAERDELAKSLSRKDDKGNATTGIRTSEGYSEDEISKFKTASAELRAKQEEAMRQVMAGATLPPDSSSVVPPAPTPAPTPAQPPPAPTSAQPPPAPTPVVKPPAETQPPVPTPPVPTPTPAAPPPLDSIPPLPSEAPKSTLDQKLIDAAGEAANKKSAALQAAKSEMDSAVKERNAAAKTKNDFSDVNSEPYKDKVRQDFLGASSMVEQAIASNKTLNPGNLSEEGLVALSKNEIAMKTLRDEKAKDDLEVASGSVTTRMGYSADRNREITNRANTLKAVENLPQIQKNNENVRDFRQIRDRGTWVDETKKKSYSDASKALPGLEKNVEEKTAAFKKLEAQTPGRANAQKLSYGIELRQREDAELAALRPAFMDKIVRNPNGGSRQATAGDVTKNPKERARLQNQADEYRSLKMNVTYRRQKEDRDKTAAAVKAGEEDAALIKSNPQVAVLRKQQAAERDELAKSLSRKDDKGNATTGIRTSEGYSEDEISKFKTASAELRAKQEEAMRQVMAGATLPPDSSSVVPVSPAPGAPSSTSASSPLAPPPPPLDPSGQRRTLSGVGEVLNEVLQPGFWKGAFSSPKPVLGAPGSTSASSPSAPKAEQAPRVNQDQTENRPPEQKTVQTTEQLTGALTELTVAVNNITKSPERGAQPKAESSASPVVNVAGANVAFTIEAKDGNPVDQSKAVAELIGAQLTKFLSGEEFVAKVKAIVVAAENAKGKPPTSFTSTA